MSQAIPAEAVEAAALVVYRTSGRKRVMSYEQARPQCESDAKEILEAAAPHMVADAGAKADSDLILTVLQHCGVRPEDQFDALVAVHKLHAESVR